MTKRTAFILLTSPFQLIYAEILLSKFKNINKVGLVIHPSLNENSFNTIKKNSQILGYQKIFDLRFIGKKIEKIENIKLYKKVFFEKKIKEYLNKKKFLKELIKKKIKINSGDIFILREKYNIYEEIYYYKNGCKYFSIKEGLDQEFKFSAEFGFFNSFDIFLKRFIANSILKIKFFNQSNKFNEFFKKKNITFTNETSTGFNDKILKKIIFKLSKNYNKKYKNIKTMIFSHPLIENKKIFKTNPKKEAKIYNDLYYYAKKKGKLRKKEIVLKIHPRVSKKNYNLIKKYLRFKVIDFNDHNISEVFLFSKKLKTIYSTGSSILLYAKYLFNKKSFFVSIKNLNINFAYSRNIEKIFKKNKFDIIRLNDY